MKTIVIDDNCNITVTGDGLLTDEERIAIAGTVLLFDEQVDTNGQIVFYSGLKEENGKVVPVKE